MLGYQIAIQPIETENSTPRTYTDVLMEQNTFVQVAENSDY